jgi:hypothetical protein
MNFHRFIEVLKILSVLLNQVGLILASAALYAFAFRVCGSLSQSFAFSHATSWVFIPAGVRMLLALILMEMGAIGVALGTLWIEYGLLESMDHFYSWGTAMIAGFSAYVSTLISQKIFKLQSDLSQLSATKLLGISAIYSIISPLMHQVWFVFQGKTEHFLQSTAMMAIGDFFGTLIVLGGIQALLRVLKSPA